MLLQNGTWKMLYNLHCGDKTTRQMLDNSKSLRIHQFYPRTLGLPIPFIAERIENCVEEFPGLSEFNDSVIRKLKPPAPHVFCVQGFQVNTLYK